MEFQPGLKLIMCPGSMPESNFESYYRQIYKCWSYVWTETFREIGVKRTLYADSFSRQDYVASLFCNDECLGLIFLRWIDSTLPNFEKDSFFGYWPEKDIGTLKMLGKRVLLVSNMAADPTVRHRKLGFHMRDVLGGLVVQAFEDSGADAIASAVRVDRKVNEAFIRWGGYTLRGKVPFEYDNDNTDLMAFSKASISQCPTHELHSAVKNLWNNRIQIPRQFIDFPVKNKRSAA